MAPLPSPPAQRAPIPDAPFHDHPVRPSLEGERHNSSDDSVATLASTASSASYTSISTLQSDFGAAELLNEPPRRGSCEASLALATPLEQRMEGLGLRERGLDQPHAVPPFLRPSASPPSSARPLLPSIVTSSSAYAGMHASSPIAQSSSLSSSPGVSPSVAVFPPSSSTSIGAAAARPHRTSSPFASPFSSPRTSTLSSSTPSLRPNFGGGASVMGGSASSSRAGSMPPSGAGAAAAASATRPSSADTTSTTSSGRPWVFDSDASSICSASSGSCGTSAPTSGDAASARVFLNDDGQEQLVDEGGEVYKPQGDYFLEDRPEPPNTSLDIDRSDPAQVVVRVHLPGFSLDNITVAMRRGHKVHVVADSYGEGGGHYEKLVTLGSDVSSSAPRAEFDGTLLRVFIQRRPSRPSSAVSVPGHVASSPFGYVFGSTPSSSPFAASLSSSPDPSGSRDHSRRPSIASSFASARSSIDSYGSLPGSLSLSPSLETYAFGPPLIPLPLPGGGAGGADGAALDDEALPPPCTARAGPPPDYHKRARCLTGPEGARAAAKAAREEAARRAREEVKNLPKEARGGRRLPFRRQKEEMAGAAPLATGSSASSGGEGASSSSSSGWGTSGSSSPNTSDAASLGASFASVERNGTIKASSRTASPLPLPSHDALTRPPLSHQSSGSSTIKGIDAVTSHALESAASQLTEHLERNPAAHNNSPSSSSATSASSRPKLRGHNLTLRPFDRAQSFVDAAAAAAVAAGEAGGASSPSASSDGGGATPRREERGMRFFTPFSS
ncbi:hypothetical protein JCM9279_005713 [Rhodotorula babjevae]